MPVTKTINFLPAIFQSDANQKFLNATLDQLVTEPNLVAINGYVGRKFAPASKTITEYIKEPSADRADYQLEPSVISKDPVTGTVDFHVTYPEVLQKIQFYGGKVDYPSRIFSNEYYSYNPHINLDAFVNFGEYYWLPLGPDSVDVYGSGVELEKTFYIFPDNGTDTYSVSGYGTAANPDIVLARGGNYTFKVNQQGKPFYIQTDPGLSGVQLSNNNLSSRQILGVTNNGVDVGSITFNVPMATDQDFFINMPVVQNVDFAITQSFAQVENQLLSTFIETYGGFDGIQGYNNISGKYLIFSKPYYDDADWDPGPLYNPMTASFSVQSYDSSVTVIPSQRYGIWQIQLQPSGSDYLITLKYIADIPVNNKVGVLYGVSNGNTEWFKNPDQVLQALPIITAPLNVLYYQDGVDAGQVGVMRIVDPVNNVINVDEQILGKLNYTSPNGIVFSN